MKYLCLTYQEGERPDARTEAQSDSLLAEGLAYGEELRASGHGIASGVLQPEWTTTIRVRHGKVSFADGPNAAKRDALGGFYLIEAIDLNDAIRVAAKMPAARLGCVEIWAIKECRSG